MSGRQPCRLALYCDPDRRASWIVRDTAGRLWIVPERRDGWRKRRPYRGAASRLPEPESRGRWLNMVAWLGVPGAREAGGIPAVEGIIAGTWSDEGFFDTDDDDW